MAGVEIVSGNVGIDRILSGANKITDAVKVTLGPKGRNVIIAKEYGAPDITKDGVTVVKAIEFSDAVENIGAQLIRSASSKTVDEAGDGTTSVAILTNACMQSMATVCRDRKVNQAKVRLGMEKARDKILEQLRAMAVKVSNEESVKNVATISANGDDSLGQLVATVISKTGMDGAVTVESGKSLNTEIEVVQGLQFDKGYISPYFCGSDSVVCELENPYILIFDGKISSAASIVAVLEGVLKSNRSLLIIADDVDGDALTVLIVNKLRGALKVCAVKSPGFGNRKDELMQDIAIMTKGKVFSSKFGDKLDAIGLSDLGSAESIKVTKDSTVIVGGKGDKADVNARVAQIKSLLDNETSEYEREKLQERIAKLSGGVGVIKVGGATEIEVKEKKDRLDDALRATKSAMEGGIVPGGGIALLRCRDALSQLMKLEDSPDIKLGVQIVYDALSLPIETILFNAGEKSDLIVDKIMSSPDTNYGFDASRGVFCDMIKSGIIDPVNVTISAIKNAISVASTAIGTEVVVSKDKEQTPKDTSPMGPY
ncbi:chaperonin GroEL [Candidatus Gromoviella agglomerans]|uniref:chaperonin GroEL n=1 Tax=Candidatus Gromoviella agglomerans TaxID=2806609 RepID=UPI001E52B21F|nr:chaperonin GroEL [Candidatus Gromoviella agglomerans]UFX98395.1 Chaperonin GroEL [Candidatus Gromoviella agglomerans]